MNSMTEPRPKPVSLRPLNATHRRWFWVLMSIAVVVIAVGWTVTIRGILQDVPGISTQVQTSLEQAAQEIEEANIESPIDIDQTQDAIEALKAGYEAEKARQQEPYGQEDTTDTTVE